MNDNQRIFAAFFIVLVAALNTYARTVTGAATKDLAVRASVGNSNSLTGALTYCIGKGDLNNDGAFTKEDIIGAQLIFSRGGQWLRESYNPALDVYPVRQPCGDGQLTQQDLVTLLVMQERITDEFEGTSINRQRCVNECRIDQVSLASNGFRTCGNTDNDPCREWVAYQCPTGYQPKQKGNNHVICIASKLHQGEGIISDQAPAEQ